jgi:hypothetical protein
MQLRDEFDLNNLGNYKMVYPVLNNPVNYTLFYTQSYNVGKSKKI